MVPTVHKWHPGMEQWSKSREISVSNMSCWELVWPNLRTDTASQTQHCLECSILGMFMLAVAGCDSLGGGVQRSAVLSSARGRLVCVV